MGTPKEIPNPDYKGPWVHPMIANPEYSEDSQLYSYEDFGVIGLDLWQVKSGTVFSNFLITDDVETAKAACQEVLDTTVKGELAMKKKPKKPKQLKKKLMKMTMNQWERLTMMKKIMLLKLHQKQPLKNQQQPLEKMSFK